ncbi:hypothetical protein TUM20984_50140 [Mycobacterium antarcticum]|nr:hypothetical protein TUM20984_50140 [Mycolicibacterium sp. TUM20984]
MILGTQVIVVVRVTENPADRDAFGNPALTETATTIRGCRFRMESSTEDNDPGARTREVWRLTAPPSAELLAATSRDLIEYDGVRYSILGTPRAVRDMTSIHHVRLTCENASALDGLISQPPKLPALGPAPATAGTCAHVFVMRAQSVNPARGGLLHIGRTAARGQRQPTGTVGKPSHSDRNQTHERTFKAPPRTTPRHYGQGDSRVPRRADPGRNPAVPRTGPPD